MKDGQEINQVNLDDVVIGIKDGKYTVNGPIVVSIPTTNGVIYVVDTVLLPPAKS